MAYPLPRKYLTQVISRRLLLWASDVLFFKRLKKSSFTSRRAEKFRRMTVLLPRSPGKSRAVAVQRATPQWWRLKEQIHLKWPVALLLPVPLDRISRAATGASHIGRLVWLRNKQRYTISFACEYAGNCGFPSRDGNRSGGICRWIGSSIFSVLICHCVAVALI